MNSALLVKQVQAARFELDSATRNLERESQELGRVSQRLVDARDAQSLTQVVAKKIQDRAYGAIAGIVSQCLEAVFEEPYKFRLDFVSKRGRTEANLTFERNGEKLDPMSDSGGGVVDVAAFALRLACLALQGNRIRRLLVLDEPFKFLSAGYRTRIRDLLLLLADKMELQILMVTHITELEVGKVVNLG